MAVRKGQYGRSSYGSSVSGNILKDINLMKSSGKTVKPAGTTDGTAKSKSTAPTTRELIAARTAAKPDYSSLDFTGLTQKEARKLKKTVETPEYRAARKAVGARRQELMTPYTAAQIASDPAKRAIAGGITYQQALASYRSLVKVMNLTPLAGGAKPTAKETARYKKLNAALTPTQRASQRILELLGGFGSLKDERPGGLTNETNSQLFYRRMGLTAPTTNYRDLAESTRTRIDPRFGPVQNIANPLSKTQRSRLTALRSLAQSGKKLTARQVAAINRLKAKKNAPTILP